MRKGVAGLKKNLRSSNSETSSWKKKNDKLLNISMETVIITVKMIIRTIWIKNNIRSRDKEKKVNGNFHKQNHETMIMKWKCKY